MAVAIDTETRLIERARLAPDPILLAVWPGDGVQLIDDRRARRSFEALLASETIVGQHVAYDTAVLANYWPDLLPDIFEAYAQDRVRSIELDQKLIDIEQGRGTKREYNLGALAERHGFRVDKDEYWRTRFSELEGLPLYAWPQHAVDYALNDARVTIEIHWAQERLGAYNFKQGPFRARTAFALHLASCWGVRTDPVAVARLREAIYGYLSSVRQELAAYGLIRPDGSRDMKAAQHRARVFARNPQYTDKGAIKLGATEVQEYGDEALEMFAQWGSQRTLLARVEDLAQGVDLPLQTSFDAMKDTGRVSSSKPRPPLVGCQAQNFPRAVGARETVVPREGWVFLIADYSMAELHTLSQICLDLFGHSRMAQLLNEGKDLHLDFGAYTLGVEYADALLRLEQGDPEIKAARQRAKPANFGFPGSMGPRTFVAYSKQYGAVFTEDQARDFRQAWLANYPEMADYFRWIDGHFAGRETASIQHHCGGHIRGGVYYSAACNSMFQELCSRGSTAALFETSRACYTGPESLLYGARIWNFGHDEIMVEVPRHRALRAAPELKAIMERSFNQFVPDVPTTAEPYLAECWSKEAGPVYENGVLVPWQPLRS